MTAFTFELINGLKVGIEHIDVSDWEEDLEWMIAIDLLIFRFGFLRYSDEE